MLAAEHSDSPFDSCLPQSLESNASDTRIVNRVFGVSMPKMVLDQPQVIALIGQIKPTGMPQHVGIRRTESGTPGSAPMR